jgi:hypothetical protein
MLPVEGRVEVAAYLRWLSSGFTGSGGQKGVNDCDESFPDLNPESR